MIISIAFDEIKEGYYIVTMKDIKEGKNPSRIITNIHSNTVYYKKGDDETIHSFTKTNIEMYDNKSLIVVDREKNPEYFL